MEHEDGQLIDAPPVQPKLESGICDGWADSMPKPQDEMSDEEFAVWAAKWTIKEEPGICVVNVKSIELLGEPWWKQILIKLKWWLKKEFQK